MIALIVFFKYSTLGYGGAGEYAATAVSTQSCTASVFAPAATTASDDLPLPYARWLGSHNSYHVKPHIRFLKSFGYTNPTLATQLNNGVRQLEFDVRGTSFSDGAFPMYHIQFLDDRTRYSCLPTALAELNEWRAANPTHFPLFLYLEIKRASPRQLLEPLLGLVGEYFAEGDLVLPRHIGLDGLPPRDAILAQGPSAWPTVGELRGRVMIAVTSTRFDAPDLLSEYERLGLDAGAAPVWYMEDLCTQGDLDGLSAYAAWTRCDTPSEADEAVIERGFISRTRADKLLRVRADRWRLAEELPFHIISSDFTSTPEVSGLDSQLTLAEGSPACNRPLADADAATCDSAELARFAVTPPDCTEISTNDVCGSECNFTENLLSGDVLLIVWGGAFILAAAAIAYFVLQRLKALPALARHCAAGTAPSEIDRSNASSSL